MFAGPRDFFLKQKKFFFPAHGHCQNAACAQRESHIQYRTIDPEKLILGDLLSIIGKLAAFYAQNLSDRVVLDAVNEIENLSSSLSNKLWLKIIVLREMMREAGAK